MAEDRFAAERQMIFAEKIYELGRLMAGQSGRTARRLLEVLQDELEDDLSEQALVLFLQAVLLRKIQLEHLQ